MNFNITQAPEAILIEIHSRGQSFMNQKWKWHFIEFAKPNTWIDYYLEESVMKKIKTKHYNCNESNNIQMTNCLNEFYMSKLNCSFPWLKSNFGSLEKCGNKHYIGDLIALIDNVVMDGKFHPDSKRCLVPNCETIKWKSKQHTFIHPNKESWYMSYIDSNLKVNNADIFFLNILQFLMI